jgi:polyferredoxin
LILAGLAHTPAHGQSIVESYPQVKEFFPQADRFGALEGEPPAAAVYRGETLVGYAFLTDSVLRIPGYSGKPINTLVGFDLSGRITGLRIVRHQEPILVVGIRDERLHRFTEQYRGISVFDRVTVGAERAGYIGVDAISGATITVMVENATVMRSARKVALSRGLEPGASAGTASPRPETVTAPAGNRPAKNRPAGKVAAPEPEEPIWMDVWRSRGFQIGVLVTGLALLTLILVFQDWLARRPRLLLYVRDGYLLFTIFFIGWYTLAQLSVMNVLTFVYVMMHDFSWESFLIDPMLFILWSFVAVTLLLWGRGVYCGWLCPYGALQELVQQLAQRFHVRQWEFPDMVHERLWAVKYIIFIVLFGVSLQSLTTAERLAEIEPFKTAFVMRWDREWGYVLFAGGLVLVSAFNRKLFCKYLCPLGAALAIPGRFRVFEWWLRRRKECGKPCQICYGECEVRAIRPTGEINATECHYCLDCQVTFYNDAKCPPMVERRRRRERGPRARELVRGMEAHVGPSGIDELPCEGCSVRRPDY